MTMILRGAVNNPCLVVPLQSPQSLSWNGTDTVILTKVAAAKDRAI